MKDKAYIREVYNKCGLEYIGDIFDRIDREKESKKVIKKAPITSRIKKKFKGYILAKKKEKIRVASENVDVLIEDLENAREKLGDRNLGKEEIIPDDIKDIYFQMRNGEFNEEEHFENFDMTLKEKSNEEMNDVRQNLEMLILDGKVGKDLEQIAKSRGLDLSEEELEAEIRSAIFDVKFDKEGKLVFPKDAVFGRILLNEDGEIREGREEVVASIEKIAKLPKIQNLDHKALSSIAFNLKRPPIKYTVEKETNEYQLLDFFNTDKEMISDRHEEIFENIDKDIQEYKVIQDISKENEVTHKLLIAQKVKSRFRNIQHIIQDYDYREISNGELNDEDTKKRKVLLKIAKKKVKSLEKAGLSQLITDRNNQSKSVIKRARGILLPQLEKAKDKSERKYDKEFGNKAIYE